MLRIEDGYLVVYEEHAGSRGGDYFYVEQPEGLIPFCKLYGRYAKLEFVSRKGRRKTYVYRVPLAQVEGKALYHFGFTNSGGFYFRGRYRVVGGSVIEEGTASLKSLKFMLFGRERPALRMYEEYGIPMALEARRLMQKTGAKIVASGPRVYDLLTDPELAKVVSLIMPTWQGRVKALDAMLKTAHELYVMALITDALKARARPLPWSSEPYWALEFASDYPSVILDSECGTFTIWYQFSTKPWFNVVREAIVEWIRGGEKRGIQHVVPDIVVFEGEVVDRREVSFNRVKLVIEAKHKELSLVDLEQLNAYAEIFRRPKGVTLVVPFLKGAGRARGLLRDVYIVEHVNYSRGGPGHGVNEFRAIVKRALCDNAS